jgi:glycosyltransferase involved in cell wall biosynthesis
MPGKILFLVPYPLGESPSQRFRFEQYFRLLASKDFSYHTESFLSEKDWKLFYSKGNSLRKLSVLVKGFLKRLVTLFTILKYDYVFIHREATPLGPPIIEWVIAKVFRRKIIYDFDDAIWLTDRTNEPMLLRIMKWRTKVASICRWSYKVSCGNEYLCDFARQFNNNVVYIPTTIDTENVHNPGFYPSKTPRNEIVVGWTGSHSTLKYLQEIEHALLQIEQTFPNVSFVIIADQKPDVCFSYTYIPWRASSEIEDLLTLDIGIMPLPDDEWAKGKCGFKALQYLALKIPAVVSPVGVNTKIVEHNIHGLHATSQESWQASLKELIVHTDKRKLMGERGREQVINQFSVASTAESFLALFT